MAKRQIISGSILLDYVLMDEFLTCVMCWHFFGRKRGFPQLWKTKRFKVFNYQLMEKIYLVQKLDFVKAIHDIPKWVASDLMALNDLRNAVAHSFFPENRSRKPEWKRENVFKNDGIEHFQEDMIKLKEFFLERFFRLSAEELGNAPEVNPPDLTATDRVSTSA